MPAISLTRAQRLLGLALPIVGGMLSQNILDIVDMLMVSQLGPTALAAVGIASFANFLAAAVMIGLGAGVQAIVARRKGEDRVSELAIPLNGGLAAALIVGIPLAAVLVWLAPTIFPYLVDFDPDVTNEGLPYWQSRLVGIVAIGLNFSFRGFWYGIGETRTYLKIIISIHVINVVVSYCLIFGVAGLPALGTLGAGIGTTTALFCGSAIYLAVTYRRAREKGFLVRLPRGQTMRSLVQLSLPSAVQTVLFAGGFTTLFWIAGQVGTDALAISNVTVNLIKFAVLPTLAFGFAAMSLVSTSLGRADPDDAARWAWDTLQIAGVVVLLVGLVLAVFPQAIIGVFLDDPSLMDIAVLVLRIQCLAFAADLLAVILSNALTGAGAARKALVVNASCQWFIGLPLAYLLAVPLGYGVVGMWIGQSSYRLVSSLIFLRLWMQGSWKTIKI